MTILPLWAPPIFFLLPFSFPHFLLSPFSGYWHHLRLKVKRLGLGLGRTGGWPLRSPLVSGRNRAAPPWLCPAAVRAPIVSSPVLREEAVSGVHTPEEEEMVSAVLDRAPAEEEPRRRGAAARWTKRGTTPQAPPQADESRRRGGCARWGVDVARGCVKLQREEARCRDVVTRCRSGAGLHRAGKELKGPGAAARCVVLRKRPPAVSTRWKTGPLRFRPHRGGEQRTPHSTPAVAIESRGRKAAAVGLLRRDSLVIGVFLPPGKHNSSLDIGSLQGVAARPLRSPWPRDAPAPTVACRKVRWARRMPPLIKPRAQIGPLARTTGRCGRPAPWRASRARGRSSSTRTEVEEDPGLGKGQKSHFHTWVPLVISVEPLSSNRWRTE
jgi:hypothetical protein